MIRVYYAKTDYFLEESIRQQRMYLLCEQRRNKILRCKSSNDQARAMTAGLLIRYALSEAGLDYERLKFGTTKYGKLLIQNVLNCYINVTHAGGYAACVVAEHPIGIDMEDAGRFEVKTKEQRQKLKRIAKRCCTEEELAYLENVKEQEAGQAFTRIWTRKESYSKLKGLGMQIGFSTINTRKEGVFWEHMIGETYQLCVAGVKSEACVTMMDCTKQLETMEIGGGIHA